MDIQYCNQDCPESEVRAEINYLEKRLAEMGLAGDCAYERALAKAFNGLLSERRSILARLLHVG